jgi:hypothetical protein
MQVTPLPTPPVVANALPQEAVAKTIPHVQAQASAPLIQRSIDPSTKGDRGHHARSNGDRAKGGGAQSGNPGGSVNIKV